jgi:hypothetical protein
MTLSEIGRCESRVQSPNLMVLQRGRLRLIDCIDAERKRGWQ